MIEAIGLAENQAIGPPGGIHRIPSERIGSADNDRLTAQRPGWMTRMQDGHTRLAALRSWRRRIEDIDVLTFAREVEEIRAFFVRATDGQWLPQIEVSQDIALDNLD